MVVTEWTGNRTLITLSTKHSNSMVDVPSRYVGMQYKNKIHFYVPLLLFIHEYICRWAGTTKHLAEMVHHYIKHMLGVDLMDQMTAYYSFQRKSIKWWRKVFFFLLEDTVNNAHIL